MPTTDDTVDDVTTTETEQPTLPNLELPEYNGRKPVGMKTSLVGAGSRITSTHSIGDKIVLVIEARMKADGHEETDDGLVYSEKHKVLDLFELAPEQGSRLIATLRSLYRTADAASKGLAQVPELGDVGYTDGSGVVLTPQEVADLRGDPIRAILTPADLAPAVVVYSDGDRELWPADFEPGLLRPRVGDVFTFDGGRDPVTVAQLLHPETGDDLDGPPTLVAPDDGGPTEDAFEGDLGDSVKDDWDTPDPRTAAKIAEDLETRRIEATLPTSGDFGLVDCDLVELKAVMSTVTDLAHARRLLVAEQQGRGRALKPRKGALEIIGARIIELGGSA